MPGPIFHQINSPNFAAYWVGKLSFSAPATKQFSVSQSWAKSRIFVDGVVVFDASNQSETFTHEFSPGEHVIEVEHINNWHTVEYKVTIEDVVDKLTESQLKDRLAASSAKPANVYYVGLYESGRKDSSVDVAVPDRSSARRPVAGLVRGDRLECRRAPSRFDGRRQLALARLAGPGLGRPGKLSMSTRRCESIARPSGAAVPPGIFIATTTRTWGTSRKSCAT